MAYKIPKELPEHDDVVKGSGKVIALESLYALEEISRQLAVLIKQTTKEITPRKG